MELNEIIDKIERLRKERGWSTYRLSEEAGITQSALINMRARNTLPSLTTLFCICGAFGITVSEFFTESKDGGVSDEERKLISGYRRLSYKSRKAVSEFINTLSENE